MNNHQEILAKSEQNGRICCISTLKMLLILLVSWLNTWDLMSKLPWKVLCFMT